MTSVKSFVGRALGTVAGVALLAGMSPHDGRAAEVTMRVSGRAPAYQVGRHDEHDRFCYDGHCLIRGEGKIDINVNPEANVGAIVATFSGADGDWKIVAKKFKLIRTDVNLHGATGGDVDPTLSPPVLPQVWSYLATWGPAAVWHNGKLAWKGPAHLMVTEEVRDPETGRVDFQGPKKAKAHPGSVHNKHAMQIHFVAHPQELPTKGYLPPFTKFVHLMYETVIWQ
ncbi:MAG: hypothetical protein ACE5FG_10265 [Myxococcota bacterium]